MNQKVIRFIQFHSHLMAYFKANLKRNGEKESYISRVFRFGNASDKFFFMWTLLQLSFKHILITLIRFPTYTNSY
jgi:hypothetical protein